MNISMSGIMASLIFSSIGLYVARAGFKYANYALAFTGIFLLIYTYFTESPLQDWGLGLLACAIAYYFKDHHNRI